MARWKASFVEIRLELHLPSSFENSVFNFREISTLLIKSTNLPNFQQSRSRSFSRREIAIGLIEIN